MLHALPILILLDLSIVIILGKLQPKDMSCCGDEGLTDMAWKKTGCFYFLYFKCINLITCLRASIPTIQSYQESTGLGSVSKIEGTKEPLQWKAVIWQNGDCSQRL
jgi:hypothetical protein